MPAGLGLMRLSTAADRDDERALATIAAALDAGVRLFDTAPSYAHGEDDLHHNERLLGRALRRSSVPRSEVTVVTKVGLTRRGTDWVLDGRAAAIQASAVASLDALDVGPIDVLMLHGVDPRVPVETSVRALVRLREAGVARQLGLSGVGHNAWERALAVTPIAALEERAGAFDDCAIRGGLVARARAHGALFLAHTPLGTPAGAARLARARALCALAERHGTTPGTLVLAWLCAQDIVPLAGATRPETAALAGRAPAIASLLATEDFETIATAIGAQPTTRVHAAPTPGEVVVIMGIQGAGKSRCAATFPGHTRLNRDQRDGRMRQLVAALDAALAAGERRLVLDNTFPTRASRAPVLDAAARHGVAVRCVWLDTPLSEAQVNVVLRMLERHGGLLAGDALARASKDDPGVFLPTTLHRYLRALEPPADEEGWAAIERRPFVRAPLGERAGRVLALELLDSLPPSDAPTLAIAWSPRDAPVDRARTAAAMGRGIEVALCEHPGGPPTCWCRPPLPGLVVRWLRAHGIDSRRSTFLGTRSAHRTLAAGLGMRFELGVAGR